MKMSTFFGKIFCLFAVIAILIGPCHAAEPADAPDMRGGVVLVLSGGGTKGFAHVGALKVLEREGIPVAGIVGVSIGSVIGGLYACGYSADEIYEIIQDTNVMGLLADSGTRIKSDAGDHRPAGENPKLMRVNFDRDLRVNGPLGVLPALSLVSFLTEYTGHLQTTDFNELPIPFACVATDLQTGDEIVFREGNLASVIRASTSIPGLLEPWPMDGRLLVDGGLVDNLPVMIAKEIFPGYPVVAVNLTGESISKPRERFKTIFDVMMQTIDIMILDRIKANEAEADIVIYPDLSAHGMLDSHGYDDIFKSGYIAADKCTESLVALSAGSKAGLAAECVFPASMRVVRGVKVAGLHESLTADLEKRFGGWIGKPYDVNAVNDERDRIANLDNVASVNVETIFPDDNSAAMDILFTVEKRPAFELGLEGYTASFHPNRWVSLNVNARDLSKNGDSANLNIRLGNNEWRTDGRYFTPLKRGGQWGFSLSASKEDYDLFGIDPYSVERYSARAMYYWEWMNDSRLGLGFAGEYVDGPGYGKFMWGPYLYYNRYTLDNLLTPSKGYSINAGFWLNEDVLVSRTMLTAYVPIRTNLRFLLNFGVETGKSDNAAYRAILGDSEGLISLSSHPLAGDQTFWANIGVGRDIYNSWWGAMRGEVFASYGASLKNWGIDKDMWETGIALSLPGQFLNGKIVLVYNSDDEFVFGFSLGNPKWSSSPLP